MPSWVKTYVRNVIIYNIITTSNGNQYTQHTNNKKYKQLRHVPKITGYLVGTCK